MTSAWAIDWLSVLILAGLTQLEGLRRIPAGALLVGRAGAGPWRPSPAPEERARWLLGAWWSPLSLRVVVAPAATVASGDAAALAARWRRLGRWVAALRVLGAAVLACVVVGIPAAMATFGWRGLVVAFLPVAALTLTVVAIAVTALRRAGLDTATALRSARGLISPFAAPRAAEVVLERALEGVSPLAVLRQLLPPEEFDAWLRPRAYDRVRVTRPHDAELDAALTPSQLARIVDTPPASRLDGERWCPRCGGVYRSGTVQCAECEGVELRG